MRLPNLKDIKQILSDREKAIADYDQQWAAVLYFSARLPKAHKITNRDLPKHQPSEYFAYHSMDYEEPGGCKISLELRKTRVYLPQDKGWEVVVLHQNENHGSREVYSLGFTIGREYNGRTLETWGDLVELWEGVFKNIKRPADLTLEEVQALWCEYDAAFQQIADLDNKAEKLGCSFYA